MTAAVRFDWVKLLREREVYYVTQGPNTARGHVSIKCPWCGPADPSEHMGLSLDVRNPAWGCFRNAQHRGRHPRRLVQKLLGVSYTEALRIVALQNVPTADEAEFTEALARLRADDTEESPRRLAPELEFPTEIRPLRSAVDYDAEHYLNYLRDRGFAEHALELCSRYGLRYALSGTQAWRVVFPIRNLVGVLQGWTGRDIRHGAVLRYRTSDGLPSNALYNLDQVGMRLTAGSAPRALVFVEGPMDALKLDYFGAALGVWAVATLGTGVSSARLAQAALAARRAGRVAVLFDPEAEARAAVVASALEEVCPHPPALWWLRAEDGEDPGALSEQGVINFLTRQLGVGA